MNTTVRPVAASIPARTAAPLPRLPGRATTWSAPAARGRVGGPVAGAVVDDDDLEPAVGRDGGQLDADPLDGGGDGLGLAVRRHDHAQARSHPGREGPVDCGC